MEVRVLAETSGTAEWSPTWECHTDRGTNGSREIVLGAKKNGRLEIGVHGKTDQGLEKAREAVEEKSGPKGLELSTWKIEEAVSTEIVKAQEKEKEKRQEDIGEQTQGCHPTKPKGQEVRGSQKARAHEGPEPRGKDQLKAAEKEKAEI